MNGKKRSPSIGSTLLIMSEAVQTKEDNLRYVMVAPAVPLNYNQSQYYTYHVRLPLAVPLEAGMLVRIEFRRRSLVGVILAVAKQAPTYPTKPASVVTGWALTSQQVQLGQWLAQLMQAGVGYTLRLFLPPASLQQEKGGVEPKKNPFPSSPQSDIVLPTEAKRLVKYLAHQSMALVDHSPTRRWRLIALVTRFLSQQGQVLILVPEKWMASVLLKHFPEKEQATAVIVHADIKRTALRQIWQGVKNGDIRLVIGTQKALWLPYKNLRGLIIEEEQYLAHKLWDQYPLLPNRYLADKLIDLHKSHILFISSFPSLWLQRAIETKKVESLTKKRGALPFDIVGLSFAERQQGLTFPKAFIANLRQWTRANHSVLMLYNQRGDFRTVLCRACRTIMRCPNCGIALVLHGDKRLQCHHCSFQRQLPKKCPTCQQPRLEAFGLGTQRLEQTLQQLLPGIPPFFRLDQDSLAQLQHAQQKKIATEKGPRLIIGTTAIFTNVQDRRFDHVVFLFPESGLLYPDFRSQERTYQTMVRLHSLGVRPQSGLVIVTRQKRLIEERLHISPQTFYQHQLAERKRFNYPPFIDMVLLTSSALRPPTALQKAKKLKNELEARLPSSHQMKIRGPFQSFRKRRRGYTEYHILLLGPLSQLQPLYNGLAFDRLDIDPQRIL